MRRDELIIGAPVIIGGGPAGAAVAIMLGRAGCRPVLLERAAGPTDKVCGDFLSDDAIRHAEALGVGFASLGAAPIRRIRLTGAKRTAEALLPFGALGLSRRALDATLLRLAENSGAIVHGGQTVRRLSRESNRWNIRTDNRTFSADTVFLATGKHDLRDWPRERSAHDAIGMKMYLALAPEPAKALQGVIELTLFPGGYAGLQCVENGHAVLCIAVQRPAFLAYGSGWSGLVGAIAQRSRRFAKMMDGARPLLSRPLAVAGVPYGYQAQTVKSSGLFRLGDQAAVIPSLTGDGMAIALHSGRQAAEQWLAGTDGGTFQAALRRTLAPQMRLAGLLHGAGLSGLTQNAAIHALRLFPGLLRQAARRTRLPPGCGPTRREEMRADAVTGPPLHAP